MEGTYQEKEKKLNKKYHTDENGQVIQVSLELMDQWLKFSSDRLTFGWTEKHAETKASLFRSIQFDAGVISYFKFNAWVIM